MTNDVAEQAVVVSVAPLVESYTADGLAFARATRVQQQRRVRWAKRTRDELEIRGLRHVRHHP